MGILDAAGLLSYAEGHPYLSLGVADVSPDNVFLMLTGKLEREQNNSAWVKAFESKGAWLAAWPVEVARLPQWLRARAATLELDLTDDAVRFIVERTEGNLSEGIALSRQTQDLANLAYFLDALAVVESAEDAHRRVAVLLGAAQALREAVGATVYGYYLPDQSLRARAEQQARTALGEDAYDDAVDSGRGFSPTDIVGFALQLDPTGREE